MNLDTLQQATSIGSVVCPARLIYHSGKELGWADENYCQPLCSSLMPVFGIVAAAIVVFHSLDVIVILASYPNRLLVAQSW